VCSKPLLKEFLTAINRLHVTTTIEYGAGTFKKKEGWRGVRSESTAEALRRREEEQEIKNLFSVAPRLRGKKLF
jgi:hypothetical protein